VSSGAVAVERDSTDDLAPSLPIVIGHQSASPRVLERRELVRTSRAERELARANAMGKLHARERNGGGAKGLHGQHRRTSSLDRAMVLLDDVVEIPATADLDGLPLAILLTQHAQRPVTGCVAVEIELSRPSWMMGLLGLGEEVSG
jgi:hypothetical protein